MPVQKKLSITTMHFCLFFPVVFLFFGCLFDSGKKSPSNGTQTKELQPRDTLVALGTIPGNVSNMKKLFFPILDSKKKPGYEGKEKELAKGAIRENGVVTGYLITGREFGSWNPERELKWILFQLQTQFFFREKLPPQVEAFTNLDTLISLVHGIDAYTQYFDSAEAAEADRIITTTGVPGAIGIRFGLTATGDTLIVKQVAPDSPADRNGVKKGAKIIAVGDSSVVGDSAIHRFKRFSVGESGTELKLSLLEDGEIVPILLRKDFVSFPATLVDTLGGNVPHIQVFSFMSNTYKNKSTSIEFEEALAKTENFPVTILDFRDNGGGLVSEVLAMCDAILPQGIIIRQLIRMLDENLLPRLVEFTIKADEGDAGEGRQYVILGNGGSASASEIFISALGEALGVPFVGETTYGKGIAQTYYHTPGQGRFKITNSLFRTRNDNIYHLSGIIPDYPTEPGEALEKALELAFSLQEKPLARRSRSSVKKEIAISELNRRERIRYQVEDMITSPCGYSDCP